MPKITASPKIERVFMVSSLDEDIDFQFPEKEELILRLKDLLEDDVDERYYLNKKALDYMSGYRNGKTRWQHHINDENSTACTLTANTHKGVPYGDISNKNQREVFSDREISRAIISSIGRTTTREYSKKSQGQLVFACAQRGRNPENPKSRKVGLPTEQKLECSGNDVSNCITTVQKDAMIMQIDNDPKVKVVAGFRDMNFGKQYRQGNRIYSETNISPTLMAQPVGNLGGNPPPIAIDFYKNLRIRKLTPRECFRLMGVSDEDFDKIRSALIDTHYNGKDRANSQLYKLAGNSIVVEPMMKWFKELFLI